MKESEAFNPESYKIKSDSDESIHQVYYFPGTESYMQSVPALIRNNKGCY
jgi:hypothetical protein